MSVYYVDVGSPSRTETPPMLVSLRVSASTEDAAAAVEIAASLKRLSPRTDVVVEITEKPSR